MTPDFNQIARRVADETGVDRLEEWDSGDPALVVDAIAEQLRQVWNMRGACDIAAIDEVAHTNETAVEAAIEKLNRA